MEKYEEDGVYSIVVPAIPHLHPLGTMVQAFDGSFQGKDNLSSGDITLNNLELSATPYGITGKGAAKIVQPLPSFNVILTCRNCAQLVDDLAAYGIRLQKALVNFDPDTVARLTYEPKQVEGFKSFLKGLVATTDGQNAPDYSYAIIGDGTPNVTVNGKSLEGCHSAL